MDVLPNALPELFFLEASEDCLSKMVSLIDLGVARYLTEYCENPAANPAVVSVIKKHYTAAIKHATYHQTLHDEGVVVALKGLNLDAIGSMTSISEMENWVSTIEKVTDNFEFVHSNIKPSTKADYEAFLDVCPEDYVSGIMANRDYFYYPRSQEVSTGLGYIIAHRPDLDIALKGLKTRIALAQTGGSWEQGVQKL